MKREEFIKILYIFEKNIAEAGIRRGVIGVEKSVPLRKGKLNKTKFGNCIGSVILSKDSFAIDYYGLWKLTEGLWKQIPTSILPKQIKSVRTKVIHFAALKIEDIAEIDGASISSFIKLKRHILALRGFIKSK